jgi:aerobic carbon-monoxide dehydrogenase large subunit
MAEAGNGKVTTETVDARRKSKASEDSAPTADGGALPGHAPQSGAIGLSVLRIEDPPLLRGEGRYAGDINFPRQLHMRIVRSPVAHGVIRNIDVTEAAALAGVVAIWTAADVADVPPISFRDETAAALASYRQHVLARDRVRYVGEPIAAVFATDPYIAEDAADLVLADIEDLPVIIDACLPPVEIAPGQSSEAIVLTQSYGDLEEAFASAAFVVEREFSIGRHSGVPLETRGALAVHDRTRDVLELHGAAKVPHRNRDTIAAMLGRSTASVVLREGHVGGGFGVRGELYPEDLLVCVAALRLRRPIKWIEDRRENLMACNHSRQQHHRIRAAVDRSGFILGIDDEFFLDQGAYVRTHGARVIDMTVSNLPAVYRFPAYRVTGRLRITNKTPAATYRGPGFFESAFVRERLLDAVAEQIGLDRLEIRRVNMLRTEEMPYARPLKMHGKPTIIDSGDYGGLLDELLKNSGWAQLEPELRHRRALGELVGAGFALFLDKGGSGPIDGAHIAVDSTGAIEIVTGGASVGQGFETAMAQICADALGAEFSKIRVTHGQTDRIAHGIGAHASRATVMTGNAVRVAALNVRAKALDMAAELLQTTPEGLDIRNGAIFLRDAPKSASISLAAVARALSPDSKILGPRDPGLCADGWFRTGNMVFPYGALIAVARIDRGTAAIAVERLLLAFDIGRAVNPMLVKGQLVGGLVQGVGGALLENFRYDDAGQPLAVTFADYLLPTLHDAPDIELLLREAAPSPFNPLGIKSAGEAGIIAVGAAIASAVDDAIGRPGAIKHLPITPQQVFDLLSGEAAPTASNRDVTAGAK